MTVMENLRFMQAQGNLVSSMNGEKVMMSVQKGKYYNLGQVGGRIWDLLSEPRTIEDVTEILTQEYEVNPSECREQVATFVQSLLIEELIQVQEKVSA
jgi:hypothetical protein